MSRPRREFPASVKRDAYRRSNGICECHLIPHVFKTPCGRPLGQGNTFYEHIVCDGAGGEPTVENCACLTKTCYTFKTNTYDQGQVADTKRMQDRARGIRPLQFRPLPGTKASGIKKPLAPFSTPLDRRTGQPIGRGR